MIGKNYNLFFLLTVEILHAADPAVIAQLPYFMCFSEETSRREALL